MDSGELAQDLCFRTPPCLSLCRCLNLLHSSHLHDDRNNPYTGRKSAPCRQAACSEYHKSTKVVQLHAAPTLHLPIVLSHMKGGQVARLAICTEEVIGHD